MHRHGGREPRDLGERLPRGEISAERVRLASFLGDEGARLALRIDKPETPADPSSWVAALREYGGDEAYVRAALAGWILMQERRLACERVIAPQQRDESRELVRVIQDWILCPCERHADAASEAAFRARARGWALIDERGESPVSIERIRRWAWFVLMACHDPEVRGGCLETSRFRAYIAENLLPWVLGHESPPRDGSQDRSPGQAVWRGDGESCPGSPRWTLSTASSGTGGRGGSSRPSSHEATRERFAVPSMNRETSGSGGTGSVCPAVVSRPFRTLPGRSRQRYTALRWPSRTFARGLGT